MQSCIINDILLTYRQMNNNSTIYKDSPLGKIPDDWEVNTLGEISEIDPDTLSFNTNPEYKCTYITLEDIDIGDMVEITKEEEIFKYVVRNKKIVSPEDFSILKTQGDKETVTLMTCWPLGAGIKRLVVVAERI